MLILIIVIILYISLLFLEIFLSPRHGFLTLVMGKAGSGKSTYIAHIVKKCNKKNRPVYCNHHVLGANKIEHTWLGKFMLEDCTIIIDEAQICFDNRDFKSFTKELKFFFSNYRHFKADVYIVSQSFEDLDVKIRRQAKKIYIMQKSLIPFTLMLQRVRMKFGVNEEKTDIVTLYKTGLFGLSFKLNFTVWHYFDSYSKPSLPPIPFNELWGAVKEKKIFQFNKKKKLTMLQQNDTIIEE